MVAPLTHFDQQGDAETLAREARVLSLLSPLEIRLLARAWFDCEDVDVIAADEGLHRRAVLKLCEEALARLNEAGFMLMPQRSLSPAVQFIPNDELDLRPSN